MYFLIHTINIHVYKNDVLDVTSNVKLSILIHLATMIHMHCNIVDNMWFQMFELSSTMVVGYSGTNIHSNDVPST